MIVAWCTCPCPQVGYPLWEGQLHDTLEPVFGELHSIFIHYTGSSIQGSETIGSATKLGLMEMLTMAKVRVHAHAWCMCMHGA